MDANDLKADLEKAVFYLDYKSQHMLASAVRVAIEKIDEATKSVRDNEKFDTRIELRLQDGTFCSFVASIPYSAKPNVNDIIFITESIVAKVKSVCHIINDEKIAIILDSLLYEDHDIFIKDLDYLKANYQLTDFKADSKPVSYYSFYRSLLNLLGRTKEVNPTIDPDPISFKIIAESCRSILLAEILKDIPEFRSPDSIPSLVHHQQPHFNLLIEDLHKIMISMKSSGKEILILSVIKEWEPKLKKLKTRNIRPDEWTASNADCLQVARTVFNKIKSIPEDRKPDFV